MPDGLGRFELGVARAFDFRPERAKPLVERDERRLEVGALRDDALLIGAGRAALRLERFHARAGGRGVGFDARELVARGLRLRALFVELELALIERVAQRREFGARGRGARGRVAAARLDRFELGSDPDAFGAPALARAQIREDLEIAHPVGDLAIALRAPHLGVEFGDAPFEFREQVVDADRVGLGAFQAPHRLGLAREEARDAGRFFEERAPFGRLRGEDRVDLPLRDDCVRARAEARAHQEIDDVAQPHVVAVDEVLALARAVSAARDLHLLVFTGQFAGVVVERHRHFGHPEGFALRVAGEDDVFHLLRAQRTRRLFAEHPADRVDEIRLARTVGPDDRGDPALERDDGLIGNVLKPKSRSSRRFTARSG